MSLAMFVSGLETPNRNLRAFWGIALGAVAAVLAGAGSLKAIQTASIATAFPMMFLLLLVTYGTFKGLSQVEEANVPPTAPDRSEAINTETRTASKLHGSE